MVVLQMLLISKRRTSQEDSNFNILYAFANFLFYSLIAKEEMNFRHL